MTASPTNSDSPLPEIPPITHNGAQLEFTSHQQVETLLVHLFSVLLAPHQKLIYDRFTDMIEQNREDD